jgi:hypothetical protein
VDTETTEQHAIVDPYMLADAGIDIDELVQRKDEIESPTASGCCDGLARPTV